MNRRKLLCFMSAIATLAIVGHYTAKPLWAQIRAALVENVDEPGRNPYISQAYFSCSGSRDCVVQFAQVPAGKRLVITNVIGNIFVQPPGVVSLLDLGTGPYTSSMDVPTFAQAGPGFGGMNIFGVDAHILAFGEPGSTPVMEAIGTAPFDTSGFGSSLTISGYLVSLP